MFFYLTSPFNSPAFDKRTMFLKSLGPNDGDSLMRIDVRDKCDVFDADVRPERIRVEY